MVLLHLDGMSVGDLPRRGTAVTTPEGRKVGVVGTTVRHHELGPIGLALVRNNVTADQQLLVEGVAAAIDPTA